jgi:hypothetical protein
LATEMSSIKVLVVSWLPRININLSTFTYRA